MKYRYLLAISAACTVASPALARDHQMYVELDGGILMADDFDLEDISNDPPAPVNVLEPKDGFDVGGIAGYDFGLFRLETELSYRRAANKALALPNGTIEGDDLSGHASALSGMLNGLLDIGHDDGLQFFAGGGVGIARGFHTASTASTTLMDDNSKVEFAWQLLGGIRVPVSKRIDLGLKYRYFNIPEYDVYDYSGLRETGWTSHSALVSLAYNFGGAEPAPPPPPPPPPAEAPPPPPPPPPPPAPACNQGPYIVFFDWDRSDITPEAATILDNAITAYGNCESVPIMLAGYADRSGSASYNVGLSQRRNEAVQAYLTGKGVPASAITSQAFGETNPRVPTADGVRELQNRRVEITYGPGSGN